MTHDSLRWEHRLNRSGARVTRQRSIILDAICGAGERIPMTDVVARIAMIDPTITRSTVYRSVHALVEIGLIVVARIADKTPRYAIAPADPHLRLRCMQCG